MVFANGPQVCSSQVPALERCQVSGRPAPTIQSAWRLCGDGRGWLGEVEWSMRYEWGRGKHVTMAPPERLPPCTWP